MTQEITDFFEAWSIEDADTRNAQVASSLSDTVFYVDPRTDAPLTTKDAVSDYVGMFSQMAPGMPVSVGNISTTLEFYRATVLFGPPGKAQTGQYFIEKDGDGKLTRLVGFVGLGDPA